MAILDTIQYYDDDSDGSYEDVAPYHHDDVQYSEFVISRADPPGFLASSAQSNTTPGTSMFDNPSELEKSGRIRVRTRDLERERWEREREIREREKERDKARKRQLEEKKRHAEPYIEYYDDSEEAVPKSKKKPSKEGSMPGMTTHSWRRLHGSRDARPFSARALIDIPNKDTISKDNTLGDEAWMASLLARAGPNMRAMHIPRHTYLTRTGTPEPPKRPESHVAYVEDAESDSDSSALASPMETFEEYSDDWDSESDNDDLGPFDSDSTSDAVSSGIDDLLGRSNYPDRLQGMNFGIQLQALA